MCLYLYPHIIFDTRRERERGIRKADMNNVNCEYIFERERELKPGTCAVALVAASSNMSIL